MDVVPRSSQAMTAGLLRENICSIEGDGGWAGTMVCLRRMIGERVK